LIIYASSGYPKNKYLTPNPMANTINISDPERLIIGADSTELTPAELTQLRTRQDLDALKQQLRKQAPTGELLRALEATVQETKPNKSSAPVREYVESNLNNTKQFLTKPVDITTQGTGLLDEAEYIYGVLLRHGIMPDKNVGFFVAKPDDSRLKRWLFPVAQT